MNADADARLARAKEEARLKVEEVGAKREDV
jgi:hypothetical protein